MNVERIRKMFPVGTRVELENMDGEPQMISGLKGTVAFVDDIGQIHTNWDNGSSLALNYGLDQFKIINNK